MCAGDAIVSIPLRQSSRTKMRCLTLIGLTLPFLLLGCNSKGKYGGKIKVEASAALQKLGVTVKDWRYSEKDKTFGVQLSASQDFGPPNQIAVQIPTRGSFSSPIPLRLKAGETQWIDFGGTNALGNPFSDLPEQGTITIDVR
jgi:hypothetical protein